MVKVGFMSILPQKFLKWFRVVYGIIPIYRDMTPLHPKEEYLQGRGYTGYREGQGCNNFNLN